MGDEPIQIPNATPAPSRPSKIVAATALLFGGLALIFLGGCFMIGVLFTWDPALFKGPDIGSMPDVQMAILLVVFALGCFLSAIWLLILGVMSLLQIIRS